MVKIGRYTAALLLVTTGVFLLLDQSQHTNLLGYLVDWWPVLLIMLGVEYMLLNAVYSKGDRVLRLDFGGLFISVLIAAIVVGTTGVTNLSSRLKDLNLSIPAFGWNASGDSGYKFEKGMTQIPLRSGTDKIVIEDKNGTVVVKKGTVQQIEIETVVYVDLSSEDKAKAIADKSEMIFSEGSTLTITAKGEEYSGNLIGKRIPRMNLTVIVPENQPTDMDISVQNGNIEASQLSVRREFTAVTSNGSVMASGINAGVKLETNNGSVTVLDIGGNAELRTANGKVKGGSIQGSITARTNNGEIELDNATGDVDAQTNNGRIKVCLLANGDYEVKANVDTGSVSTDFPLNTTKRSAEGKIGGGNHPVKLRTNNGSIEIGKVNP